MVMKKAASMIELVIAIVVMGIAVMTLPMMLAQTQKNNEFTLKQEILLAARTKIGDILTYRWDKNSLQDDRIVVLQVTNGDIELVPNIGTRRIGHVHGNKRRKFSFGNNASTAFGDANITDLDDFDGVSSGLTLVKANLDYRFTDLNMTSTVQYVSDDASYSSQNLIDFTFPIISTAASTNIKMITLVTKAEESTFTLRAYSTNIGESEFLRRDY